MGILRERDFREPPGLGLGMTDDVLSTGRCSGALLRLLDVENNWREVMNENIDTKLLLQA